MPRQRIGWIGTGVMGRSMCSHIIHAGFTVMVYTRTKEKASSLLEGGAVWCDSPGEVARESDMIFTMVGYPEDVEEVYFSGTGLIENAKPHTIYVDMSTSRPSLAQRISRAAQDSMCHALDAPVSGGDVGAREGTLAIMVGGDRETFEKILPLFKILGKNISLMGGPGAGQHTKMCNQILIASTMIGVVESLLYACRAGLDPEAVIDIISTGAAGSWSLNNLGRRIVKGDYDPGFFIKHFIKDMGIALDEARRMKLCLPGLALACQFYVSASALGYEDLGTQGLYKVFERMNNT
ncbi:MAG TPA: NAD(P)-dependent oxidoreductase [Desulfomonilia bacterium]|nr:NAD(P)-dependent oxidoreductase [Desulfomonilia bacterium]